MGICVCEGTYVCSKVRRMIGAGCGENTNRCSRTSEYTHIDAPPVILLRLLSGQGCTLSSMILRELFPRQVDKESRGPQGERGLEFSRRKKGQSFFLSPHSLGLYNNTVSCLRTVFGFNLLLS